MTNRQGRVLDSTTMELIPNATVILRCQKKQFHGSRTKRIASTKSNSQGEFKFSFWHLGGCDLGFVNAKKDGYRDTKSIDFGFDNYSNYTSIPEVVYLTNDSDAIILSIKYWIDSHPLDRYLQLQFRYEDQYRGFIMAKYMSKTEREIQFVKNTYCASLISLFPKLSALERGEINKIDFSVEFTSPLAEEIYTPKTHNFEKEVVHFCGN